MPLAGRAAILALLLVTPLWAQREQRQPLTEAQIDQVREAGVFPDERIALYAKFVDQHVSDIKALAVRGHSAARAQRMDNDLQDLTALFDELASNLDQYGDRKADLRKSLKALNESAPHWLETLRAVAAEPGFDLSRKEAIDSSQDLTDQVSGLLKEQTAYFAEHKDEKGQERAEPK